MGAIRLFLAIVVAVAHLAVFVFPTNTEAQRMFFGLTGNYAVMLFFIVSGFLMSFVLEEKYGYGRRGVLAFYKARILRIYPLWWAMLAIVVLFLERDWLAKSPADIITTIFLVGPELRTAFAEYPQSHATFPGALGVGWSLGVEVLFYITAPFLLRFTKVAAILCVALLGSRLLVAHYHPYGDTWITWNYWFFPHLLPFFLFGHFSRLIWKRLPITPWLGLIPLLLTPICFRNTLYTFFDSAQFFVAAGCFALALPPVFELTKNNRVMNWLGDLSYPLYLTHPAVIKAAFIPIAGVSIAGELHRLAVLLPLSDTGQLAAAAYVYLPVALAIAWIAKWLVEEPIRTALDVALRGAAEAWSRVHGNAAARKYDVDSVREHEPRLIGPRAFPPTPTARHRGRLASGALQTIRWARVRKVEPRVR